MDHFNSLKDGRVYYFNGIMPLFSHHEKGLPSFRFITAQLVVLGNATQAEIIRSFGISTISMKRYVARERLCLRGTTDYCVNDALGQPFFSINAPVNPGLLEIIRREIVHRLEQDVPNQPSEAELEVNPWLFRFALVFDREWISPDFFLDMLKKCIVCYIYRKYQSEDWRRDEFSRHEVKFPNGEVVELELAERGTFLGRKIVTSQ